MLNIENTVLVVVDVQGKLATLMHEQEAMMKNIISMAKAARTLALPVLWMEQIPDKLGPTAPELADVLEGLQPIAKSSFSCCGHEGFMEALDMTGREQVLLVGIESHICVYQTAVGLLEQDYHVEVVTDAVSSRTEANKQAALDKMAGAGVELTSVEMALFELLKTAEAPQFRNIARLIK